VLILLFFTITSSTLKTNKNSLVLHHFVALLCLDHQSSNWGKHL
jgi:hypothetical protein